MSAAPRRINRHDSANRTPNPGAWAVAGSDGGPGRR